MFVDGKRNIYIDSLLKRPELRIVLLYNFQKVHITHCSVYSEKGPVLVTGDSFITSLSTVNSHDIMLPSHLFVLVLC